MEVKEKLEIYIILYRDKYDKLIKDCMLYRDLIRLV